MDKDDLMRIGEPWVFPYAQITTPLTFKVEEGEEVKSPLIKNDLTNHPLVPIFEDAVRQATSGKGQVRHGTTPDFLDQPIFHIAKLYGPRGPAYQVAKKLHEAIYCLESGRFTKEEAYQELLGSLVYLGAIAIMVRGEDS